MKNANHGRINVDVNFDPAKKRKRRKKHAEIQTNVAH